MQGHALMSTTHPTSEVPGLDAAAARRWQTRRREASPWLHEEVASRMADRLNWFRQEPASWLHWEPLIGGVEAHRRLVQRLPKAACHVAAHLWSETCQSLGDGTQDNRWWSPGRWSRVRGPAPVTPDTRVDMLWANMQLHLEPQPQALLKRWHSHVAVDGFLMFSCLGPDSLKELRAVYARQGWPDPCHAFTDMHDWGDMLVHGGFAEPVMDMERIVLTFSTADALLNELRSLGRNVSSARFAGLRGRRWRTELLHAMDADLPRNKEGRLELTFEIVYGHAFKPRPRAAAPSQQNVPLEEMRAMLRSQRR